MRKLLFSLLISGIISSSLTARNKPAIAISGPVIDERIELTSIAVRLAGYDEYSSDINAVYVQAIHQYFDKYKDHPLIKFLAMVRDSDEIGFDAVANMAVYLGPPPALQPVLPFTARIPDERWKNGDGLKLLPLLRAFYRDTHFDVFFKQERPLYEKTILQFDSLFRQLDVNWYPKYYGVPAKGNFHVIVAPGNGGANYGPKVVFPDGHEERYAIMGVWQFRPDGTPTFRDDDYLPTLIHEFNHSFVNYLVEAHKAELEGSGQTIFTAVADKMKRLAYGNWQEMMSESLVRASVIRYLKTHYADSLKAINELRKQVNIGFVWMPGLVDLLGSYETDRKTYPDLAGFMPRIIGFYQEAAANIQTTLKDFTAHQPRVSSLSPQITGDSSVSDTLTRLKVTFDRPLSGKGYSINRGQAGEYPIVKVIGYTENNQAVLLELKLKAGTTYSFTLTGRSFMSADGYPLQPYDVQFRTKDQ